MGRLGKVSNVNGRGKIQLDEKDEICFVLNNSDHIDEMTTKAVLICDSLRKFKLQNELCQDFYNAITCAYFALIMARNICVNLRKLGKE